MPHTPFAAQSADFYHHSFMLIAYPVTVNAKSPLFSKLACIIHLLSLIVEWNILPESAPFLWNPLWEKVHSVVKDWVQ